MKNTGIVILVIAYLCLVCMSSYANPGGKGKPDRIPPGQAQKAERAATQSMKDKKADRLESQPVHETGGDDDDDNRDKEQYKKLEEARKKKEEQDREREKKREDQMKKEEEQSRKQATTKVEEEMKMEKQQNNQNEDQPDFVPAPAMNETDIAPTPAANPAPLTGANPAQNPASNTSSSAVTNSAPNPARVSSVQQQGISSVSTRSSSTSASESAPTMNAGNAFVSPPAAEHSSSGSTAGSNDASHLISSSDSGSSGSNMAGGNAASRETYNAEVSDSIQARDAINNEGYMPQITNNNYGEAAESEDNDDFDKEAFGSAIENYNARMLEEEGKKADALKESQAPPVAVAVLGVTGLIVLAVVVHCLLTLVKKRLAKMHRSKRDSVTAGTLNLGLTAQARSMVTLNSVELSSSLPSKTNSLLEVPQTSDKQVKARNEFVDDDLRFVTVQDYSHEGEKKTENVMGKDDPKSSSGSRTSMDDILSDADDFKSFEGKLATAYSQGHSQRGRVRLASVHDSA